jgi:hypothetical protein
MTQKSFYVHKKNNTVVSSDGEIEMRVVYADPGHTFRQTVLTRSMGIQFVEGEPTDPESGMTYLWILSDKYRAFRDDARSTGNTPGEALKLVGYVPRMPVALPLIVP